MTPFTQGSVRWVLAGEVRDCLSAGPSTLYVVQYNCQTANNPKMTAIVMRSSPMTERKVTR